MLNLEGNINKEWKIGCLVVIVIIVIRLSLLSFDLYRNLFTIWSAISEKDTDNPIT